MEENEEPSTPFWVQSTANQARGRHFRNGVSSFFMSSGLLVSILLVAAVSFLVFVVPSTISLSYSQIFRPNNVKKSWDSLNLVLVLFALVFGFLSRNKNDDRKFDEYQTSSPSTRTEINKSNPSNSSNLDRWYGYSDQTAYNTSNKSRGGLMRRTSSSYPDLLEASSRLSSGNDPWRSYDDINIDTPRYSGTSQLHHRQSWKYTFDDSQLESKDFYVDKFVNHLQEPSHPAAPAPAPGPPLSTPPPAAPPAQSSPPPVSTPLENEEPGRTHHSVGHNRERRRKRKDNQGEHKEPISEPATPPPPPPPPPPLPEFVDRKSGKTEKKRTGATTTKDFLNSLYHKKKKKQRQRSVENFDALFHQPQIPPLHFQIPPPSPPPPSVFQNLFSTKKPKRKTALTVISVPIPTPSAPAPAISGISQFESVAGQKPPQLKVRSFDSEAGNSNSGRQSPLTHNIPPPPPPPPPPFFKSPAWKFVVQGDYVRVNSNLSSRSGSPDLDDVESDVTPTATDAGGDASPFPPSPLFCPSPDVDTKAENFISKFRAGLKLEKIDSMNKRQGLGLSNLGPGSGPTHI